MSNKNRNRNQQSPKPADPAPVDTTEKATIEGEVPVEPHPIDPNSSEAIAASAEDLEGDATNGADEDQASAQIGRGPEDDPLNIEGEGDVGEIEPGLEGITDFPGFSEFPPTGDSDAIYHDTVTNTYYLWSVDTYVVASIEDVQALVTQKATVAAAAQEEQDRAAAEPIEAGELEEPTLGGAEVEPKPTAEELADASVVEPQEPAQLGPVDEPTQPPADQQHSLEELTEEILEHFAGLGAKSLGEVRIVDPATVDFDYTIVDGELVFLVSKDAAVAMIIDGDEDATKLTAYLVCAKHYGVGTSEPFVAPALEDSPVPDQEEEEVVDPVAQPEVPVELTLTQVLEPLYDESKNLSEADVTALRERLVNDRRNGSITKDLYLETLRLLASKVYPDVDRWEDQSLVRWGETGLLPGRIGKLLKHDRIRAKSTVDRWSDEELTALLLRKIDNTFNVDITTATREYIRRHGLNALLTNEQVRVYVETEVLPKSVFHESDLFQLRPAYYWSDVEINEFIQGRLPATKAATQTDIYDEYRRRHDLTKTTYPDAKIQGLQGANDSGVKVHMAQTILESELKSYATKMAPSAAITEAGAGAAQTALYRQMKRVLSMDGQDFVTGWTTILDFFQAHRETHFDEMRRMRGLAEFQLGSRDRATFEQLVNLCVRTADPKVRYEAGKNTNFGVVLAKISDEAVRHRVLAYYRVGQ